jgi:hypothetical protein
MIYLLLLRVVGEYYLNLTPWYRAAPGDHFPSLEKRSSICRNQEVKIGSLKRRNLKV